MRKSGQEREEKKEKKEKQERNDKLFILTWLLIVAILLLLILLLQNCNGRSNGIVVGGYSASNVDLLTSKQESSNSTKFNGRTEYYIVKNGYVPFYNSNSEKTLIYEILDSSEEVVFKSDNIAPKKEARWYLDNKYEKGEYTFYIKQTKVNEDGTLGNSVKSEFKITVY